MKKNLAWSLLALTSLVLSCSPKIVKDIIIPKGPESKYAYAQVEPSIAIHPTDTNIMAIGTVLDDYYYSKDGGLSWESQTLKSTYGVYGDPVLKIDDSGRVYYFHLAHYKKSTHLDRIVCQTSPSVDKGFNDGTFPLPNGTKVQDKHWVYLDKEKDRIIMTWTQFDAYNSDKPSDSSHIMFSYSADKGDSWSQPLRIDKHGGDCLDDDKTVEGAMPVVLENGDIIVTWSGPKGLVLQKSEDDGKTWLANEKFLFDQKGGWNTNVSGIQRSNGLPVLTLDKVNNVIYLNWCAEAKNSKKLDVWLSKSTDNGETWSKPKKVNKGLRNKDQFFTWSAVDQSTGEFYVAYFDRQKSKGNETNVIVSYSKNQGRTFKHLKVNPYSFVPDEKVFFGDYLSIDAVSGCVRVVYPMMVNGKIELHLGFLTPDMF